MSDFVYTMVQTNKLSFRYSEGTSLLTFPDIFCNKGSALLITGDSGSGKTTLLSMLGGLISPNSGSVEIEGTVISSLSAKNRDRFRGKSIGFILQQHYFIEAISVLQNLTLAQKFGSGITNKESAIALLSELKLSHKKDQLPSRLSVGERQRLSIARALINKPAVILADEPTSSLDNTNCEAVIELLQMEASQSETALIVVTHDERLKRQFSNQINL